MPLAQRARIPVSLTLVFGTCATSAYRGFTPAWHYSGSTAATIATRHRSTWLVAPATEEVEEAIEADQILELLRALPVDEREAASFDIVPTPLHTPQLQPSGASTDLSIDAIQRAAKSILASGNDPLERQQALAELSGRALAAGRVASAQLAYDLAEKKLRKWRAKNRREVPASRALVRAGLLAAVARRDRAAYEDVLLSAQEQFDVNVASEPSLLSSAMVACCEAGWLSNANAINITLAARGLSPTTAALNALMAARLSRGDESGVFDAFLHMKRHGPQPDRESQALATRAAALRKGSWSGLRNLMRRPWLKIPWNPASAEAALASFVARGNLKAAAGVLAHCQAQRTPVRLAATEEVLEFASVTCASEVTSLRAYKCMQQHAEEIAAAVEARSATGDGAGGTGGTGVADRTAGAATAKGEDGGHSRQPPPLSANARLLVLPHLPDGQRVAFCAAALGEVRDAAELVLMQAALALVLAAEGRPDDAASWLLTLHSEGVDMGGVDVSGRLGRMVGAMAPAAAGNSLSSLLDVSPALEQSALRLTAEETALEKEVQRERHERAAREAAFEAFLEAERRYENLSPEARRREREADRAVDDAAPPPSATHDRRPPRSQRKRKDAGGKGSKGSGGSAGGGGSPAGEASGRRGAGERRRRARGNGVHRGGRPLSLWALALRSCGSSVDGADALCAAMDGSGELEPPEGKGLDVLMEYLRVCARAAAPDAAVLGLRKLGDAAPAEAFVSVVCTCCAGDEPRMDAATTVLDMMDEAGKLEGASPGQYLRLYVSLVTGFGRRFDLDAAHSAFEEGCEWLKQAQQQQVKARIAQRAAEEAARQALLSVDGRATASEEDDALVAQLVAQGRGGPSPGATGGAPTASATDATTGASAAATRCGSYPPQGEEEMGWEEEAFEWEEEDWLAAERSLVRVMVEAAAPHPRGLLLSCTLLEQLTRRSGQGLKHGYYAQLIKGHATAHDLHVATSALVGAQRHGLASSGWRVSDATIATLMEALSAQAEGLGEEGEEARFRQSAIRTLSSAGLQMDRKVAEYLDLGRRSSVRGSRKVNANDEIVSLERSGGSRARGAERAAAARGLEVAAFAAAEGEALLPSTSKQQYEEFEELLQMRPPRTPRPGEPKQPKDTKRAVDARRLKNLQPPRQ